MNQKGSSDTSRQASSDTKERQSFVLGLWGVRYQVKDVSRSIAFHTKQLDFKLDQQRLPAFAQVSVGGLKLILSGPELRAPVRCRMAVSKSLVDGTVFCFTFLIFLATLKR